jgi:ABC-type spermidine/putrescine transport system permease subunit I
VPGRPFLRVFLVGPALVLLLVILVVPTGRLLALSLGEGEPTLRFYGEALGEAPFLRAFASSLWLAVATTVLTVVLGYPLAYWLAGPAGRIAGPLFLFVLLPFWTSVTVRTFAFLIILGRQGPINSVLLSTGWVEQPLSLLFNAVSVLIGLTHIGLPLMVLPLYAAMRQIDPSLVRVAQSLGAGPGRAFWEVFFPLSLPGVAAGSTLVFMTTIGAYVIPALLGGKSENMIAQFIVTEVNVFRNLPLAAALTVGLLGVTVLTLVSVRRFVGLERIWDTGGRVA